MSRTTLSLYELDREALQALSAELRASLESDDLAALCATLELSDAMRPVLQARQRLVDAFLLPPERADTKPLWSSLRRIAKKRALTKVLTSSDQALEGRLRSFEPLRERRDAADLIDKLLNPKRLPWYLRVKDASGGWIDGGQRRRLVAELERLRPRLTPELIELADALGDVSADAVLHDGL